MDSERLAETKRKRRTQLTPEQKQEEAERLRLRYAKLTPQQRHEKNQRRKQRRAELTPEQRFEQNQRRNQRRAKLSPEQRSEQNQRRNQRRAKLTPEQRSEQIQRKKQRRAELTPEQRFEQNQRRNQRRANQRQNQRRICDIFNQLWTGEYAPILPSRSWAIHFLESDDDKVICLSKLIEIGDNVVCGKKILINNDSMKLYVYEKLFEIGNLNLTSSLICIESFQSILESFDNLKLHGYG